MSPWVLEGGVLHLNHGSFGATPAAVLEAQQRVRSRMEANPTRYFLGGAYQRELDVPVFIWPAPPDRLLRISAHLYNNESQYRRLAEALAIELRR